MGVDHLALTTELCELAKRDHASFTRYLVGIATHPFVAKYDLDRAVAALETESRSFYRVIHLVAGWHMRTIPDEGITSEGFVEDGSKGAYYLIHDLEGRLTAHQIKVDMLCFDHTDEIRRWGVEVKTGNRAPKPPSEVLPRAFRGSVFDYFSKLLYLSSRLSFANMRHPENLLDIDPLTDELGAIQHFAERSEEYTAALGAHTPPKLW